ncbi:MAG: rubrerythrin family protein, partial [Lachnospiraceae bacterium]|nr:rubrerythrin family protein [Lachnospiraceae bacterium]
MKGLSRREFMKGTAATAIGMATMSLLAGCAAEAAADTGKAAEATGTVVGTTYENLLTALQGETNAYTKYEAFAEVAKSEGYDQIARLFQCTADAEKIHVKLELALAQKMKPETVAPTADAVHEGVTDANLITGAQGEIYETSDMYPAFIKKAQEEGETEAVGVFTRAKLAEGYHAELYMNVYNT